MKEQIRFSDSQVPVFCYPNLSLHSFCIGLYIKAGVLYEEESRNGVSHFLEHALFRSLNESMGGTLYETLDKLGLEFSGCTYKELIQFKITGAPSHFEEASQLLLKLFRPMSLSTVSLNLERKRIKAEIRENNDLHSLDYYSDQLVWEDTPLSMPITGTHTSLARIFKKDLEKAKQRFLARDRIHFYLTGCVSDENLDLFCCLLNKVFLLDGTGENPSNEAPIPASFGQRGPSVFFKQAPYCYVKFSFDLRTDDCDSAVLDYLYDHMFVGDSCKTYLRLSEETGYIYSFDPCLEKYNNIGCLTLSFEVSRHKLIPAVKAALSMFAEARNELPDLSRIRPSYVDNLPMLLDQPEQLNWIGGYEHHILNIPDTSLEHRRKRYESVSPKQVQWAARKIFRKKNLCLAVKVSGNTIKKEDLEQVIADSDL